jgi:hypothetical protein
MGVSVVELEAFELINSAAPAVPSFEPLDMERSGPMPCECLSAAAEADTACAMDAAVAAVTAAAVDAAACKAVEATAGAGYAPPAKPPGAATPVSGAGTSLPGEEDSVMGALLADAVAAAMMA